MKVKVELCNGHEMYFRLTFPDGNREMVFGESWGRKQAREALNICEYVYGLNRKNVRFVHH